MDIFLPLLLTLPPSALSAIALSLGFGVAWVVFFYLGAYALQNPPLFAIAKEELAALIFSIMIVFFWMALDGVLSTAVVGLISSASPNIAAYVGGSFTGGIISGHVELGIASLELLFVKLKQMYVSLYLFEALIGFLSTMSFPIGSPVPAINVVSFSLMPFDGLVLLSNAHTIVVEAIGYLMMLIWAKQFILIFARDAIPIILLPFGLICRAFPFFRTTGSSIIAICIAGYFVFPLAILLSNYMIFDLYQPADFIYSPEQGGYASSTDADGKVKKLEKGGATEANKLMQLFAADPLTKFQAAQTECAGSSTQRLACGVKNLFSGMWEALKATAKTMGSIWYFMMGFAGDFFYNLFSFKVNPLLPSSVAANLYLFIIEEVVTVSQFVVVVIFTSVLEIIFTVTMYRNIAMLIGGEAEIVGLTKLV